MNNDRKLKICYICELEYNINLQHRPFIDCLPEKLEEFHNKVKNRAANHEDVINILSKEKIFKKDSDMVRCGTCKQIKKRQFTFKIGKERYYIDEDGLRWNGKKYCGSCNQIRINQKMKEIRDRRKKQ